MPSIFMEVVDRSTPASIQDELDSRLVILPGRNGLHHITAADGHHIWRRHDAIEELLELRASKESISQEKEEEEEEEEERVIEKIIELRSIEQEKEDEVIREMLQARSTKREESVKSAPVAANARPPMRVPTFSHILRNHHGKLDL